MKTNTDNEKNSHTIINRTMVGIIIFASLFGSIYGIYTNLSTLEYTTTIYLWISNNTTEISLAIICSIWWKYFKRVCIVWISSFYRSTYIVGYIVLFCLIFSFGFTSVSLIMILDKQDVIALLIYCLFETIITVILMIEIINKKYYLKKFERNISYNIYIMIKMVFYCIILTIFDVFVLNYIIFKK